MIKYLYLLILCASVNGAVTASDVSSDGQRLILGDSSGLVTILEIKKEYPVIFQHTPDGDSSPVQHVHATLRNGVYNYVYTTQGRHIVFLKESTQSAVQDWNSLGPYLVTAIHPGLQHEFLGYTDKGKIWTFSPQTGSFKNQYNLPGAPILVSLKYSLTKNTIGFVTNTGACVVLKQDTYERLLEYPTSNHKAIDMAFSADREWFAVGCDDGQIEFYSYELGKVAFTRRQEHNSVECMVFAQSGHPLIIGYKSGHIGFINPESDFSLVKEAHAEPVLNIHNIPDGQFITIDRSGVIKRWDLGSASILETYIFHP